MRLQLYRLNHTARHFLAAFIVLNTVAVLIGLIFVLETTSLQSQGIVERYRGSEENGDFDFAEQYPKSVYEMLLNTHNHLFGFSFIFLATGSIFYFNSVVRGRWKYFLMVEPFLSALLTFAGLWLIRFVDPGYVYIVFISALLTYIAFFIMVIVLLYDLLLKRPTHE